MMDLGCVRRMSCDGLEVEAETLTVMDWRWRQKTLT